MRIKRVLPNVSAILLILILIAAAVFVPEVLLQREKNALCAETVTAQAAEYAVYSGVTRELTDRMKVLSGLITGTLDNNDELLALNDRLPLDTELPESDALLQGMALLDAMNDLIVSTDWQELRKAEPPEAFLWTWREDARYSMWEVECGANGVILDAVSGLLLFIVLDDDATDPAELAEAVAEELNARYPDSFHLERSGEDSADFSGDAVIEDEHFGLAVYRTDEEICIRISVKE